ncbi:DUF371 domain-containing protein [uncultured Jatrophihabitans sp.]|uniref:DUF371 domain-containing protein n=1 Tax=uncultured Jatrophihabitans sp. TaxID=1610747 RepID=UPI0035CB0791
MRLTGRGSADIRATHRKTMELTPDESITERATCVIGIGVRTDDAGPVAAGPVTITITAGGNAFSFDARANSSWTPGPAVIRRSPMQLPGTLAVDADAASADLPRDLVAALTDPHTQVEIDVRPRRGLDALVLLAVDPTRTDPDPRLAAELAVADAVLAEDGAARAAVPAVDRLDTRRALTALPPGRVLVVAGTDLPGAALLAPLRDNRPVETVGLLPGAAAAAAAHAGGPITYAPRAADLRAVLLRTPATHRLVVTTPHDELGALLGAAKELRGTRDCVLVQQYAQPVRTTTVAPCALPAKDTVYCCLEPLTGEEATLDPAARAAVTALLTDGVPTRTAARALAELTGWPRRDAYDAVLHIAR